MAAYGNKSVGTSATAIVDNDGQRTSVVIQNNHASNDLYLGTDDSVTSSNGLHLAAGDSVRLKHRGAVYGIGSAASTDVRYFQEYFA